MAGPGFPQRDYEVTRALFVWSGPVCWPTPQEVDFTLPAGPPPTATTRSRAASVADGVVGASTPGSTGAGEGAASADAQSPEDSRFGLAWFQRHVYNSHGCPMSLVSLMRVLAAVGLQDHLLGYQQNPIAGGAEADPLRPMD